MRWLTFYAGLSLGATFGVVLMGLLLGNTKRVDRLSGHIRDLSARSMWN